MTTTLTARRLLTHDDPIDFPVITIDNGRITAIASDPSLTDTDTLAAAFLDIHIHGATGHDVMQASPAGLSRMQQFLAARGVAYYLPTTVTASIDATLRALETLANAIEAPPRENEAQPIGIHLEGPFVSHAKRGVHPPHELQPPSTELFDRFQTAARGHIALMTIAPEPNATANPGAPRLDSETWASTKVRASALDLIRHAVSQNVRISIGHSNATVAQTLAAIDAGATSATHTFNAMRALEAREPGVLGTVLDDDRLFAEIIADGVHVSPALVRLWLRAKTKTRAILVTDAISATGQPDGDYMLGNLPVRVAGNRALLLSDLEHGKETLAGSVLTMDRAVANLQAFTGASLADATRLASHNPAAMLGRPELTRTALGAPAHLNRFNAAGHLTTTYLHGHAIPF